jgi:hypothetical protein
MAGCRGPAASTAAVPPPLPVRFTDITREAGLRFVHHHGGTGRKYFVETSGSGACFFDYDQDGDADLYVVQSGPLPDSLAFGKQGNCSALYRNDHGRFMEVTDEAGVGNFGYGQGCCAADYDGDGDLDLYVTNFGANRLYRNEGNGIFKDVTASAHVAVPGYNTGASFADIDGDGDLDLYVARYARYRLGSDPPCSQAPGLHSYCPPAQFDGDPDVLLRNNGDGTFTDITAGSGISDPHGKGLGVLFVDYDQDGKPDLYVANDGTLNRLYHNLGGDKFADVTAVAGVGMGENGRLAAGMGIDSVDVDGDGRLDLFVSNFTAEPNDLYVNRGDGTFDLRSTASGLGGPSIPFTGFGAAFIDYDLDGLSDVLIANGHVADDIEKATPGITYAEPTLLCRNVGNGSFEDVSASIGGDLVRHRVGRGMALADIDGDGDLDVLINNSNSPPTLLRNDGGNQRHWTQLKLVSNGPNRFAIGAMVRVSAGGRTQTREVRTGASYLSQHDFTLTLGLGLSKKVDAVTVRWPDGKTQQWHDLPSGQLHVLNER